MLRLDLQLKSVSKFVRTFSRFFINHSISTKCIQNFAACKFCELCEEVQVRKNKNAMVWMSVWKVANSLSNSEIVFHLHTYNIRLSVHMHILHIHFLCLVNVYKSENLKQNCLSIPHKPVRKQCPLPSLVCRLAKCPAYKNSKKKSNRPKCKGASHPHMLDMHLIYLFSEMKQCFAHSLEGVFLWNVTTELQAQIRW